MGVYLSNIEMPKTHPITVEIYPNGTVLSKTVGRMDIHGKAVHIEPHGRLIDAYALMLEIQEYIEEYGWETDEHGWHNEKWCAMKEAAMAIDAAPTIIEAEEGE